MKVLWITNTIFPAACLELGLPAPYAGGWMYSGAEQLLNAFKNIELGVATLYEGKSLKIIKSKGITYFLLPGSKPKHLYDLKLESFWKEIKYQFKPDVVHIHGSEYPHGLAYVNACGNEKVVMSVQGLVGIYERYYYGGIPVRELRRNITLRDIIRNDTIFGQRTKMQRRAKFERELIKKVDHIIGRTSWDKTHIWAINPTAKYHFCNETLRAEFYQHIWEYGKCEKNTVFLSQAHYPIKGLHQLIEALPLILRDYPDTKVYVAGNNFFPDSKGLIISGFGKFIRSRMRKYNLENKIIFTGVLSEIDMCKQYLKSNVFVCPSSIENSPNSVGEAQLLGVPTIASYVGGVSDMVMNEKTGLLYRFEEVEMLANAINFVFSDNILANTLSRNGRIAAICRHNREEITQNLNSIYNSICKKQ